MASSSDEATFFEKLVASDDLADTLRALLHTWFDNGHTAPHIYATCRRLLNGRADALDARVKVAVFDAFAAYNMRAPGLRKPYSAAAPADEIDRLRMYHNATETTVDEFHQCKAHLRYVMTFSGTIFYRSIVTGATDKVEDVYAADMQPHENSRTPVVLTRDGKVGFIEKHDYRYVFVEVAANDNATRSYVAIMPAGQHVLAIDARGDVWMTLDDTYRFTRSFSLPDNEQAVQACVCRHSDALLVLSVSGRVYVCYKNSGHVVQLKGMAEAQCIACAFASATAYVVTRRALLRILVPRATHVGGPETSWVLAATGLLYPGGSVHSSSAETQCAVVTGDDARDALRIVERLGGDDEPRCYVLRKAEPLYTYASSEETVRFSADSKGEASITLPWKVRDDADVALIADAAPLSWYTRADVVNALATREAAFNEPLARAAQSMVAVAAYAKRALQNIETLRTALSLETSPDQVVQETRQELQSWIVAHVPNKIAEVFLAQLEKAIEAYEYEYHAPVSASMSIKDDEVYVKM